MKITPQLVAAARNNDVQGLEARVALYSYCKKKFFLVANECNLFDYISESSTEFVFEKAYHRVMDSLGQVHMTAIPFFPVFNTNNLPIGTLLHLIAQIKYVNKGTEAVCLMSHDMVNRLKNNFTNGVYNCWHEAKRNEPLHFVLEADPHAGRYQSISKYIEDTGYSSDRFDLSISEIISMLIFFPWYIQHRSFVSALTSRREKNIQYHVGIISFDSNETPYCECKEKISTEKPNDDIAIAAGKKRLYI